MKIELDTWFQDLLLDTAEKLRDERSKDDKSRFNWELYSTPTRYDKTFTFRRYTNMHDDERETVEVSLADVLAELMKREDV